MAMGDLQLDSNSLVNSGSIVGNNVAVTTTNDITNNNFSEVIATNGLNLTSNSGSIVNFSKLKAGGAVSLTAANNITNTSTVKTNAANLLDSGNLAYVSNGGTASNSGNISSTLFETAAIEAASFTANAGNDFSNIGSNINSTGDISITAGNDVNIDTAKVRNRSEFRSKKYTKITDTTTNTSSNIISNGGIINIGVKNDILVRGSNLTASDDIILATNNGDITLAAVQDKYYFYEASEKKGSFGSSSKRSVTIEETNNIVSNLNSTNGSISLISGGNNIIEASSLRANDDVNILASNSNYILNATDSSLKQVEVKNKGTFTFKNNDHGYHRTKIIEADFNSNQGDINIIASNGNLIQFNESNKINNLRQRITNNNPGNNFNINQVLTSYVGQKEINESWDITTRGLTEVSQAIIAVAATAVMPGIGSGLVGAGLTAASTTAATTAIISAANAGLNGGNLGDMLTDSFKSVASGDGFERMVIAALSAGLTVGITEGVSYLTEAQNGTQTLQTVQNAAQMSDQLSVTSQAIDALRESMISNMSSSITQSAINGDSLVDSLKNQVETIAIGAISNVAAQQIGGLYYGGQINKPTQLALHAALGCGAGTAGGRDCASGAVSGVTGELAAEFLDKNFNNLNDDQLAELSGLTSGFSAILTGGLTGQSNSEIAQNIYSGQRIGKNAAENNYLSPKEKMSLVKELKDCDGDVSCQNQVQEGYERISQPRDKAFEVAYDACNDNGDCAALEKIHYDLRQEWTDEGNEYYSSLTPEQREGEFILLSPKESIFHTFKRDPETGNLMNVSEYSEAGYSKYVHPIYGYEIILNDQSKIVTDPLNAGTYNFYNPNLGADNDLLEGEGLFGNHMEYDVDPYFLIGNASYPLDPTTEKQRKQRRWLYFD